MEFRREWELRLLSAEIERHVRTSRITTTELRYLLHDLTSATTATDDDRPPTAQKHNSCRTVEVELPCSVQTAEAFLNLVVTPADPSTGSADEKVKVKVDGRGGATSDRAPRRRVVDLLQTASLDAVVGIPSDARLTPGRLEQHGTEESNGATEPEPAVPRRFCVSDRVEWCLGDGGSQLLELSAEEGNTIDDLSISAWCEHHHLTHLQTRLEAQGVDRWCLRDLVEDETLRVELIMDDSMEFSEAEEHQMMQALGLPEGTWFQGTVVSGGGDDGTAVLLDDGRSVYVRLVDNADECLLRPLTGTEAEKKQQKKKKKKASAQKQTQKPWHEQGESPGKQHDSSGNGKKRQNRFSRRPAKAATIEEAIAQDGWEVKRGGKHIKLVRKLVLEDGSEVYQRGPTLSCTPSDIQARSNQLADFNRLRVATFDQMQMLGNAPPSARAQSGSSMASRWNPDFR